MPQERSADCANLGADAYPDAPRRRHAGPAPMPDEVWRGSAHGDDPRIHTGQFDQGRWACGAGDCGPCADAYSALCREADGGGCFGRCSCGRPCQYMEHATGNHACAGLREAITVRTGERQW